jgi:hypothetical protein
VHAAGARLTSALRERESIALQMIMSWVIADVKKANAAA